MATDGLTGDSPAERSRRPAYREGFAEPNFSSPATAVSLLVTTTDDEVEKFLVHKEYACAHSPILRAAFDGPWKEGRDQEFRLTSTTTRAARLLCRWLYSETHELNLVQLKPAECPTDEESLEEDLTLAETWVLADFLRIPRLQNDIVDYMNRIAADLDRPPSSAVYEYIYENTAEYSALRKAIVILVVAVMDGFCIRRDADDYPKDMLVDIVETMGNMRKPILSYQNILKAYPQAHVPEDK
ncbi:hypothetical protein BDZ45DRAFT_149137 [Acephala macrosclerotiorum]|nr:hypothetical protein BDZ45DRAFT_149137 [Acephala macrosclerotiorum]